MQAATGRANCSCLIQGAKDTGWWPQPCFRTALLSGATRPHCLSSLAYGCLPTVAELNELSVFDSILGSVHKDLITSEDLDGMDLDYGGGDTDVRRQQSESCSVVASHWELPA